MSDLFALGGTNDDNSSSGIEIVHNGKTFIAGEDVMFWYACNACDSLNKLGGGNLKLTEKVLYNKIIVESKADDIVQKIYRDTLNKVFYLNDKLEKFLYKWAQSCKKADGSENKTLYLSIPDLPPEYPITTDITSIHKAVNSIIKYINNIDIESTGISKLNASPFSNPKEIYLTDKTVDTNDVHTAKLAQIYELYSADASKKLKEVSSLIHVLDEKL
jgi:hypothetical protein